MASHIKLQNPPLEPIVVKTRSYSASDLLAFEKTLGPGGSDAITEAWDQNDRPNAA